MTHRRLTLIASVLPALALFAWTPLARAWGDLGHTIVCEIAFHEMNDKARAAVLERLQNDENPRFKNSYGPSCVWPDHPKKRSIEHYINVSRSTTRITSPTTCPGDPCLLAAIAKDLHVLQTSTDAAAKLES